MYLSISINCMVFSFIESIYTTIHIEVRLRIEKSQNCENNIAKLKLKNNADDQNHKNTNI